MAPPGTVTVWLRRWSIAAARPIQAARVPGNVLLCSSFSKTLAPGYRVGWLAPGRYMPEVQRLKFATNVCTATLPQAAIAGFLTTGYDRHLRRARKLYAKHLAAATGTISGSFPAGTRVTRPKGGFLLWVELLPSIDSLELYRRALEERITLAPGPLFSATGRYRSCIRLSCAGPVRPMVRGVARLGELAVALTRARST